MTVHRYEEFIREQPTTFEWPEIDERAAAALCYTSGTTGNPKGVAYSHRSIYLHSFSALTKDGFQFGADDTVQAIVPQFHANAWGRSMRRSRPDWLCCCLTVFSRPSLSSS